MTNRRRSPDTPEDRPSDDERRSFPAAARSEPAPPDGLPLGPLCALFAVSGFAALVYQVTWTRYFGLLFGSTTRAASVVLAAFFLGMAVGNWLGGRWARGQRGALLAYGIAELAIAIGALAVLPWLGLYRVTYPSLYQSWLGSAAGLTIVQTALALVAMSPPCVAMGATLPLMSRAVLTRSEHLGRRVSAVYALNTAGATAGALVSGFLLLRFLGTRHTLYLAASLSAAVGVGSLLLWRRESSRSMSSPDATEASRTKEVGGAQDERRGIALPALFAAVSGFGTLALEVLYTRLLLNFADSSVYTFAIVLAAFLVCLALGSAGVSLFADRLRSPWTLTAWAAAGGAVAVMVSPSVFQWTWHSMQPPQQGTAWTYFAWLCAVSALLIAPGTVFLGAILPSVWKTARSLSTAGAHIGRLTAINTLAAVAGSLAAAFVLLPALGVAGAIAFVAGSYGLLAVVAILRAQSRWRALWAGAFAVGLVGAWALQPARIIPVLRARGERIVHFHEGPSGNVSVTRRGGRALWMRHNNTYVLGSTGAGMSARRSQGRLGLLLHPEPENVSFIGVATGLSMSAIRDFPGLRRVVAMEIVPGVLEAAEFFDFANLGVLRDPRVASIVADGRNHLFGTDETFDVVVGDLFVPWQAGTAYLYTVEHFEIVRERLRNGGLYVQWLQANQVTVPQLRIIAAGFTDVFPDAELWLNRIDPNWPLIALVGRRGTDAAAPEECLDRPATRRARSDPLFAGLDCVGGGALRQWASEAPRNTDDRPVIEFRAGLSHFRAGEGNLESVMDQLEALGVPERSRSIGSGKRRADPAEYDSALGERGEERR